MNKFAAACLATTVSLAAAAQSGLSARPLNATCVAPAPITMRTTLEPVALAELPGGSFARGEQGGLLYQGKRIPGMAGLYLFVDADGMGISARLETAHGRGERAIVASDVALDGLAENDAGEVFALAAGQPFALRADDPHVPENFPATLSATGCFDAADVTQPAPGLIPYAPSAPLYSDNASKRRWLAMPDWQQAGTQISLVANGDFDFPPGTILIKEFSLGAVRVETRFFIHHLDGVWRGYSYQWNDEQTDATLLAGGASKDFGGQTWTYPSRFECDFCHSAAANVNLGPEIAQLNHDLTYPSTGLTANQLATLDAIGLFNGGLPELPAALDALPAYDDESAPVNERARGYLHSNCSGCHRPGGPGLGAMDLRYFLDGSAMNVNDVYPQLGTLGIPDPRLVKRGAPDDSILPARMRNESFFRMPPLGVSILDEDGAVLIERWIASGLGFGVADSDGDELADDLDNCSLLANFDQRDTDGDGFGNACDADLNNDNIVNVLDLGLFKARFFSTDPDADFNGDGIVNVIDLGVLKNGFFAPPGPGAVSL